MHAASIRGHADVSSARMVCPAPTICWHFTWKTRIS